MVKNTKQVVPRISTNVFVADLKLKMLAARQRKTFLDALGPVHIFLKYDNNRVVAELMRVIQMRADIGETETGCGYGLEILYSSNCCSCQCRVVIARTNVIFDGYSEFPDTPVSPVDDLVYTALEFNGAILTIVDSLELREQMRVELEAVLGVEVTSKSHLPDENGVTFYFHWSHLA